MGKALKIFEFISYWSLVAIPCSIAIAPFFSSFFMGMLLFSYFMKKILKKEKTFVRTPLDIAYFLFMAVSCLSIFNSVNYISSIRGIFKLIQNGLLFLIVAEELQDTRHAKRVVLAMLLGATLASIDALWQMGFGKDFIRGYGPSIYLGNLARATASFPNSNVLGVYLVPMVAVSSGLALYYFKGSRRFLASLVGLLILLGVYFTFSRFAGLAALLSLLSLAVWRRNKVLITILALFLLLSPFLIPRNIKDWAKSIHYNPVIFAFNADRICIYRNTINMISHHPVLGVGLNTFSLNYAKYKLFEPVGETTDTAYSHVYAHNNFLHMAGEIGLLGLSIFILFLIVLFKTCFRIYRRVHDPFIKTLSACLTISLLAYLVNGMSETSLYYARVVILFWFIIGFVLALGTPRFLSVADR